MPSIRLNAEIQIHLLPVDVLLEKQLNLIESLARKLKSPPSPPPFTLCYHNLGTVPVQIGTRADIFPVPLSIFEN